MTSDLIALLTSRQFVVTVLVAISVFAAMLSLLAPMFGRSELKSRMQTVAIERDEIRKRERARMKDGQGAGNLRVDGEATGIFKIADILDLKKALADEHTQKKLRAAGLRGNRPMSIFLFCRLVLPFVTGSLAAFYIFGIGMLLEQTTMVRIVVCVFAAYAGFYLPNIYLTNVTKKRRESIQRAWPDSLDLLLICCESGMSVEAGFRRVATEIGTQSVPLAEEMVLVGAELSYLPQRRQAYENLADRTGLDSVKSVSQALIQAERYGTPVGQALRVLAAESREQRMLAAEKKAAALPPKLTVPMILFFLPVLFAVIMGPAGIELSARGGVGVEEGDTE